MYKSTTNGILTKIKDCYVVIPGGSPSKIEFDNLPDLSDSKSAVYNDENIIGRSNPLHTYSHSANRTINISFHLFITKPSDALLNLRKMRTIQSALYPQEGAGGSPFQPPPICQIKCGDLLAMDDLCVVLQNCSVKFPSDVAWWTNANENEEYGNVYCPYKFDIDTSWLVVYTSKDLPFNNRIVDLGR